MTILAILKGNLLERWITTRQAKFRTLICAVSKNILLNRMRIQLGRERILSENREYLLSVGTVKLDEGSAEYKEIESGFYSAWGEELLQRCLQSLQEDYLRTGRSDYFRVLYGRICEDMRNAEIATNLNLKISDVENYYKRSRQHLSTHLYRTLTEQVVRYCEPNEADEEVALEWGKLGVFLKENGGLDLALRMSYEFSSDLDKSEKSSQTTIMKHVLDRDSN